MTDTSVVEIAVQTMIICAKLCAPILHHEPGRRPGGVALPVGDADPGGHPHLRAQADRRRAGADARRPLDAGRAGRRSPTTSSTWCPGCCSRPEADAPMTVELAPALVTGYLLALVRAAAWVFVCPPFGNRTVPMMVKVGPGRRPGPGRRAPPGRPGRAPGGRAAAVGRRPPGRGRPGPRLPRRAALLHLLLRRRAHRPRQRLLGGPAVRPRQQRAGQHLRPVLRRAGHDAAVRHRRAPAAGAGLPHLVRRRAAHASCRPRRWPSS